MKQHAWTIAAFVWGLAEGTLFFIVPDVLLSVIALRQGARPAYFACIAAAIGAACGGTIMYVWSGHDPRTAMDALHRVPAVGREMITQAQASMSENWFHAMLAGPLTRTPYKVYAILAPHLYAPLWLFIPASILARLPRFLIVSFGVATLRRWLEPLFGMTRLTWVLAVAWVVFYAVFFAITPGYQEPPTY